MMENPTQFGSVAPIYHIPADQIAIWNEFMITPHYYAPMPDDNILKSIGPLVIYKEQLGRGGFGVVYNGSVVVDGNVVKLAVKLQDATQAPKSFLNEVAFYCESKNWPEMLAPKMFYHGEDGEHRAIGLELLGASLENLHKSNFRCFSLKTVLLLADQMISRVETLHSKGYIHRDLKPDNFVIGQQDQSAFVYLIDYGNSQKYLDENNVHKEMSYMVSVAGTVRYLSKNAHKGFQQSRKDDMIALFNIFMYFLHGKLPWQGRKYESLTERIIDVYHLKKQHMGQLILESPEEFRIYYNTVKELKYEEKPDYDFLRSILRGLAAKMEYEYDFVFDWTEDPSSSPASQNYYI